MHCAIVHCALGMGPVPPTPKFQNLFALQDPYIFDEECSRRCAILGARDVSGVEGPVPRVVPCAEPWAYNWVVFAKLHEVGLNLTWT